MCVSSGTFKNLFSLPHVMWKMKRKHHFPLLNRALATFFKQDGYIFNPRGWVVDEARGNWMGLKAAFGEDTLKKSEML